ncbi:MAG: hypothetical protein ACTH31_06840 [Pseudoclavibacter sp.]
MPSPLRLTSLIVALGAVVALAGCASGGAPEPTMPEMTYAGAPTTEPGAGTPPPGPGGETVAPEDTAPAETPGETVPATNAEVRYAAIGGSEITGTWSGGCSMQQPIGVSAMEWRAFGLPVANGRTLAEITVELSVGSIAADGTMNVTSFGISGAYGDGEAFDATWEPIDQYGDAVGSVRGDEYSLNLTTPDAPGSLDLQVYCAG